VMITHDIDLYMQTDSKAAALLTKLLGSSAPKMADQAANQMLLFFSGLTRYCEKYPEDIKLLFAAE